MSKFVNYKKRSVTLPRGCKNLIDVLQPHGLPKLVSKVYTGAISPNEKPTVTRGESFTGGLSGIDKYVTMVFESRAHSFILMVTPPDEKFTVDVDRMEDGTMGASVVVQSGTEQESCSFLFRTTWLADPRRLRNAFGVRPWSTSAGYLQHSTSSLGGPASFTACVRFASYRLWAERGLTVVLPLL